MRQKRLRLNSDADPLNSQLLYTSPTKRQYGQNEHNGRNTSSREAATLYVEWQPLQRQNKVTSWWEGRRGKGGGWGGKVSKFVILVQQRGWLGAGGYNACIICLWFEPEERKVIPDLNLTEESYSAYTCEQVTLPKRRVCSQQRRKVAVRKEPKLDHYL